MAGNGAFPNGVLPAKAHKNKKLPVLEEKPWARQLCTGPGRVAGKTCTG